MSRHQNTYILYEMTSACRLSIRDRTCRSRANIQHISDRVICGDIVGFTKYNRYSFRTCR